MKKQILFACVMLMIFSGCERYASNDAGPAQPAASASAVGAAAPLVSGTDDAGTKRLIEAFQAECQKKASSGIAITDTKAKCSEQELDANACPSGNERSIALLHPGLICRRNELLLIKLNDDRYTALIDEGNEEHVETIEGFQFTEYFPDIQYGVIMRSFYEGGTYDLIDLRTGQRTNVDGRVLLSPDKRRFVAYDQKFEGEFVSPSVLSVYLITPEGLKPEFAGNPMEWGPEDASWIDSQTIEFMQAAIGEGGITREPHKLRFTGKDIAQMGKWVLDGNLGETLKPVKIALSDIEAQATPYAAIVSVIPTQTGAHVTVYGLNMMDALKVTSDLSTHYGQVRAQGHGLPPINKCGATFQGFEIDILGDSSGMRPKQSSEKHPVKIKTKDGGTMECVLP